MWCRDITHDITAPLDDVTSEHKKTHLGRGASEVPQSLGQGLPRLPGDPHDATPSPTYLVASP